MNGGGKQNHTERWRPQRADCQRARSHRSCRQPDNKTRWRLMWPLRGRGRFTRSALYISEPGFGSCAASLLIYCDCQTDGKESDKDEPWGAETWAPSELQLFIELFLFNSRLHFDQLIIYCTEFYLTEIKLSAPVFFRISLKAEFYQTCMYVKNVSFLLNTWCLLSWLPLCIYYCLPDFGGTCVL